MQDSPSGQPEPIAAPAHSSQFQLLGQRRFAPFFWTQFLGVANDNIFRFAFIMLVTNQLVHTAWLTPLQVGSIVSAVFVLPFLLFSATAGQLTDKYDKTLIVRAVKNLEIAIALIAAWGFVQHAPMALLFCTFLMGLHSTLFGPVKYALLPQVLNERELVGGNGMMEMGTFVAILLGQLAGTLLIDMPRGAYWAAAVCVLVAVLGRTSAQWVPRAGAAAPDLRINWNPFSETWNNLKLAYQAPVVFRSLLGISWMWFFGAAVTTQFPALSSQVLHGDGQVTALLLVVFSIGVGTGALLCEKLSHNHVEIGLVPLGAIGMSVFAIDLYFALHALAPVAAGSAPLGLAAFLANHAHWRVLVDLALLALAAGLYSVPMYALVQLRSPVTHRARIIAANNILNALFMIVSAGMVAALIHFNFTLAQVFLITGLLNALVAFYIFMLVPEYLLRFVAWLLSNIIYRYKVRGSGHIPLNGPVVVLANHVSFVDPVLMMSASPRPIRFLMDHRIFQRPILGYLFRLGKAIPIAPREEDPALYEAAMQAAQAVLQDGDVLGIYPEGRLSPTGQLMPFKAGIIKILQEAQAQGVQPVVVPMALTNLWGSYFSRVEGSAMRTPFRRGLWSRVGLNIGAPLRPDGLSAEALQAQVARLLRE